MSVILLRHFKRPRLLMQTKCVKFHNSNQKGISGFINSSREKLRTSLKEYQYDDYNEIYMRAYRLPSLVFGTSFNEAGINVVPLNYDAKGNICHPAHVSPQMQTYYKTLKFGKLYKKGLDVLQEYSYTGEVASLYKPALLRLLHFLDEIEIHEKSLALQSWKQRRYRRLESVQPAIIANHLLSKLVTNKNYFLDHSHDTGWECPCGSCKDEIKFGNALLGYEEMWFGLPDIILNPDGTGETSVLTPDIRQEMYNKTEGSRYAMECDSYSKSLRRTETVNQSITQAITFSLYQANKNQKRHTTGCDICLSSSLIPTIAITSNAFDIYMYDYENDVLLRNDGPPVGLWTAFEQKLNIISIIQIWLIINHMLFEARLNSSHIDALQKTSDFHNHCGDKLAVFKERVRFLSNIEHITREFSSYEKPLCIDD